MTGAEKRREARIDQVLDAAAECFVDHGFHGAGMAKIAKKAGMSVGHIYHYFDSKEAIIAAIVDRESALATERFSELEKLPKAEVVEAMMRRVEEMVTNKADSFQSALNLEIMAECKRNCEIAKIVHQHDRHVRSLFHGILATKLGLSEADARVELLLSLFGGLSVRIVRNPVLDRHTLIPMFRQMMALIMQPDRAPN